MELTLHTAHVSPVSASAIYPERATLGGSQQITCRVKLPRCCNSKRPQWFVRMPCCLCVRLVISARTIRWWLNACSAAGSVGSAPLNANALVLFRIHARPSSRASSFGDDIPSAEIPWAPSHCTSLSPRLGGPDGDSRRAGDHHLARAGAKRF